MKHSTVVLQLKRGVKVMGTLSCHTHFFKSLHESDQCVSPAEEARDGHISPWLGFQDNIMSLVAASYQSSLAKPLIIGY